MARAARSFLRDFVVVSKLGLKQAFAQVAVNCVIPELRFLPQPVKHSQQGFVCLVEIRQRL